MKNLKLISILSLLIFTFTLEAKVLTYKKVQSLAKTILETNDHGLIDQKINDRIIIWPAGILPTVLPPPPTEVVTVRVAERL